MVRFCVKLACREKTSRLFQLEWVNTSIYLTQDISVHLRPFFNLANKAFSENCNFAGIGVRRRHAVSINFSDKKQTPHNSNMFMCASDVYLTSTYITLNYNRIAEARECFSCQNKLERFAFFCKQLQVAVGGAFQTRCIHSVTDGSSYNQIDLQIPNSEAAAGGSPPLCIIWSTRGSTN